MTGPGLATVEAGLSEDRAVESIRHLAGFDLLGQVRHALQDARWLVYVVADPFELRRPGQDEKPIHPGFHGAANVRFHGVADHGDMGGVNERVLGQLATRAVKHVAVGLPKAEV